MSRILAVALTSGVGVLVALQAPVNSRLGRSVGTLGAATISFAIGTLLLLILTSALGGWNRVDGVRHVGIGYLTGGVLGVAYVSTVLVTVRTLGAGGVTAATIAGQLTAAVMVDQLGLLGVARHPVSAMRIAGVVLLAAGTFLVMHE